MDSKSFFKVVFIVSFLVISINHALSTQKLVRSEFDKIYAKEFSGVMGWLEKNSNENDVVLAEWVYGHQIAALANRNVIATSKVYPSEVKIVAERYKDISRFFFATSETSSLEVVTRYNISFVLLSKNFDYKTCRYINICNLRNYQKYMANGDLLPQIRSTLIVTRMLDKKRFDNYNLAFESDNFLIYKVVKNDAYYALNKTHYSGLSQYKKTITNSFKTGIANQYSGVSGGIVPHYIDYAQPIITNFFQQLNGPYKTIIIMGPDHFHTSTKKITASSYNWETPFGILRPNLGIIERLNLTKDEFTHINEHSIRVLLPFIKYKFPNAEIVPILLRNDLTKNEAVNLGHEISKLMGNDTLVIASMDFSHIQPPDKNLSIKQDTKSLKVIQNFEIGAADNLSLDSKPSLIALLTIMNDLNATKTRLFNLTNSALLNSSAKQSVGFISLIFMRHDKI